MDRERGEEWLERDETYHAVPLHLRPESQETPPCFGKLGNFATIGGALTCPAQPRWLNLTNDDSCQRAGAPLKLTENVGIVCKRTFRTYFKLPFRTTSGEPNPNPLEGRALGGGSSRGRAQGPTAAGVTLRQVMKYLGTFKDDKIKINRGHEKTRSLLSFAQKLQNIYTMCHTWK